MQKKSIYFLVVFSLVVIVIFIKQIFDSSDIGRFVKAVQNDGNIKQLNISNHDKIGEKVKFAQPYVYIIRNVDSIVPTVAQIKNELVGIHPKLKSELKNIYMPSNKVLTITEVFNCSDIINQPRYYYILTDKNTTKYTISKASFERLINPIYLNAVAPLEVFDKLYLSGKSISIEFLALKDKNDKLNANIFKHCNVEIFSINKWGKKAVGTVDFEQLSCLYQFFWDDFHSERLPISFQVIESYEY